MKDKDSIAGKKIIIIILTLVMILPLFTMKHNNEVYAINRLGKVTSNLVEIDQRGETREIEITFSISPEDTISTLKAVIKWNNNLLTLNESKTIEANYNRNLVVSNIELDALEVGIKEQGVSNEVTLKLVFDNILSNSSLTSALLNIEILPLDNDQVEWAGSDTALFKQSEIEVDEAGFTINEEEPVLQNIIENQEILPTVEVTPTATIVASGTFGTAPWTIDDAGVLHIYEGEFPNYISTMRPWLTSNKIITKVVFEGAVKAATDSSFLFVNLYKVTEIVNLDSFDTSVVTNMRFMFLGMTSLTVSVSSRTSIKIPLDVSH